VTAAIFVLLYSSGYPLCHCPRYYLELSAIGLIPLFVGPRLYRYLGAAILVAGLLSSEADRRGAIREQQQNRHVRMLADLQTIRAQLAAYKAANDVYPSTDQGLRALIVKPASSPVPNHWTKLFREIPTDPWHSEYVYRCPGEKHSNGYDLWSAGPDRVAIQMMMIGANDERLTRRCSPTAGRRTPRREKTSIAIHARALASVADLVPR
jgi:general secretion pathway protein G